MEKAALRKNMIALLQGTDSSLLAERSLLACGHVIQSDVFQNAHTILCYAAMPLEANPEAIAREALMQNKRVTYPYCVNNYAMQALIPATENGWETGAYGILTPILEESVFVPPEEIDLVIVPGLAFDLQGGRLGRGKGYYDRYLSSTRAYTVGFAFASQLVDFVPAQPHDAVMCAVATEKGIQHIE